MRHTAGRIFAAVGVIAAWLPACAATHKAPAAPTPSEPETAAEPEAPSEPSEGVTPDQLNALNDEFRQRAPSLSNQCYTPELERTHDKKMKGTVTLKLTVEPDGSARDVAVAASTLANQTVESCLVSTISAWHLPTLSVALPWSWTYTFEPEY